MDKFQLIGKPHMNKKMALIGGLYIRDTAELPGGKNDRIKKRKRKAYIPSGGMG